MSNAQAMDRLDFLAAHIAALTDAESVQLELKLDAIEERGEPVEPPPLITAPAKSESRISVSAGPLPQLKWERFAQEVTQGTPYAIAYERAGFKPGPYSRHNGSKLAHRSPVKERIQQLLAESAREAVVGMGFVQHLLIDIAMGRAESMVKTDAEGRRFTETDRLAALLALSKTLGISDGTSLTVNASAAAIAADISDEDRQKALAALFAKFKARAEAA
jgi:hypothetical protein